MRRILCCLSFIITTLTQAQEVELLGKYSTGALGDEVIEFTGRDSFYFRRAYCSERAYGKGRCEIRNDQLFLYFETLKNTGPQKDTLHEPVIIRTETTDSSTYIDVTCVDNDDRPIPFTKVEWIENGTTVLEATANDSGRASFRPAKNRLPVTLKAIGMGFEVRSVDIQPTGRYSIKIPLRMIYFNDTVLTNGEIYVYDIRDLSEEMIVMKLRRSSEPFKKFKKRHPQAPGGR